MTDVYSTIAEADPAFVERLADVLEIRAADPQQRAMLETDLADITFPPAARVLEVGCGTGAVSRKLARLSGVASVEGVDPSPVLLARARKLADGIANLSFTEADGRAIPFDGGTFDVVIFHTTLCHVPGPEHVLAEAHRVLRPGGWVAVFDGDYATLTLAIGDIDPLQACADAVKETLVHDRWFVRRLSGLIRAGGFEPGAFRSFGYVQTPEPTYLLTIVDRGADALANAGRIGPDLAAALKVEARYRVEDGRFFGHIAFASLIARKPVHD
jgi:ubiquinone/menaquinone biosynthesis C-methylase UbiE